MKIELIDKESILYLVNSLQDFEKDKAIKSGLKSAANVFRKKGKSNLKGRLLHHGKQTSHLLNSFTTRTKRSRLGALAGFDRPGGNHSHLIDLGTRMRFTKSGAKRGIMPANKFWTDAKISEEKKAMDAIYKGVEKAVLRINSRR
ncbi:MAG: hypothetical protein RR220_04090 [Bacteroidaceae bacterium]